MHGLLRFEFTNGEARELCRVVEYETLQFAGLLEKTPQQLGIIEHSALNPRTGTGEVGLRRHRFGSGRRGGFGLGGGAGGPGDAGDEELDQFDRALQGAAGVAADVLLGREG